MDVAEIFGEAAVASVVWVAILVCGPKPEKKIAHDVDCAVASDVVEIFEGVVVACGVKFQESLDGYLDSHRTWRYDHV